MGWQDQNSGLNLFGKTFAMEGKNQAHPFDKLAKPAQRALASAGITSLEDLSKLSEKEFIKLHGIGKNALQKLKADMTENGLSFTEKGLLF